MNWRNAIKGLKIFKTPPHKSWSGTNKSSYAQHISPKRRCGEFPHHHHAHEAPSRFVSLSSSTSSEDQKRPRASRGKKMKLYTLAGMQWRLAVQFSSVSRGIRCRRDVKIATSLWKSSVLNTLLFLGVLTWNSAVRSSKTAEPGLHPSG